MLSQRDLEQIRQITREVSAEVSREVLREELPKAFEIFEIRMDRKMDARFAAQERWITTRFDRLEGEIDGLAQATAAGFARVDERFAQVDERFAQVDERFDQVDERFARVDERFDQMDEHLTQVDARLERVESRLGAADALDPDAPDGEAGEGPWLPPLRPAPER